MKKIFTTILLIIISTNLFLSPVYADEETVNETSSSENTESTTDNEDNSNNEDTIHSESSAAEDIQTEDTTTEQDAADEELKAEIKKQIEDSGKKQEIKEQILKIVKKTPTKTSSDSATRKMLDNFKSKEKTLLYKNNLVFSGSSLDLLTSGKKIDIFSQIKEKIAANREVAEGENQTLVNRISSLEEAIKSIDDSIEESQADIKKSTIDIIKTTNEISSTEQEILDLNDKIEANKKIILEYLVHIYKSGNIVYDGEELDSLRTILIEGKGDLADILSDYYFKNIIEITGQELIAKHRAYVKELFLKKKELQAKQTKLKDFRAEQIVQKNTLIQRKTLRTKILDITKGNQAKYEEYIKGKLDEEKAVQMKMLRERIRYNNVKKDFYKEYKCPNVDPETGDITGTNIGDKCRELSTIIKNESALESEQDAAGNIFSWPVDPAKGISAYFKDPSYTASMGSEHEAIDIRTAQGTDIVAPADGYVIYESAPVDEGYAYVALKHADGYITVYGHISGLSVKKYDFVRKGEAFAKSGGARGSIGAGPATSGPHLHFEIIKDKEFVDPLYYLNLTELGRDNLPNDKYIEKYTLDYKGNFGFSYEGGLGMVISMLRNEEGFRENAYKDSAGVWTIGYGFTSINGRRVQEGDTMTRDEAEKELVKKANWYTNYKKYIKVDLTLEQHMALTSFEYNLGRGIWTKPTEQGGAMPIIDKINSGDLEGAAEYLKGFNNAGGKVLRGLTSRRNREAVLLLSGV
ncbi:MAG: peptidoglycan DD-metalloendopeptidase family protein [Candidatus Gracilibacteria bacterium]|nr:peptidoglycan DD-metalloendopeptidase family protein [Candidatus Gracilibacteria bacterium]